MRWEPLFQPTGGCLKRGAQRSQSSLSSALEDSLSHSLFELSTSGQERNDGPRVWGMTASPFLSIQSVLQKRGEEHLPLQPIELGAVVPQELAFGLLGQGHAQEPVH
jgi:hypothetical protein